MKWLSLIGFKGQKKRADGIIRDEKVRMACFLMVNFPEEVSVYIDKQTVIPALLPSEREEYFRCGRVPTEFRCMAEQYADALLSGLHRLFVYKGDIKYSNQPDISITDKTVALLKSATDAWERLPGELPYKALEDYFPVHSGRNDGQSCRNRRLVWNFKYSEGAENPLDHARSMVRVTERLQAVLTDTFGEHTHSLTIFCVPASSADTQWLRYREFSRLLCARTGMQDSFSHVQIRSSREPVHLGGRRTDNWQLEPRWFNGRPVIIFDDVMTTGASAQRAAVKLREAGAIPIAALFIAHTVKKSEDMGFE